MGSALLVCRPGAGWRGPSLSGGSHARVREPVALPHAALVALLVTILSIVGLATPASAEPVGSVSGTVRSAGVPVANAWVSLMPVTPTGDWAGKPVLTTTDRDGRYEFSDLYASHVKIQVRAPSFSGLASAYWPDAYSFATAGTLRVASSGRLADVDLPASGSVSGRVVDADTGAPVLGARVLAHVDAPPGWEPVGSVGLAPGPGQFVRRRVAAGPGDPAGAPAGGQQPPRAVVRRCRLLRRGRHPRSRGRRESSSGCARADRSAESSATIRVSRSQALP